MTPRRTAEYVVGAGLLLGPLVYALSLPVPEPASPIVVIDAGSCETSTPPPEPEIVVVGMCEELEPAPLDLPPGYGEFLFVDAGQLVLAPEATAAWGVGELYQPGDEFSAAKHADVDALPEAMRAMATRTYDLYDGAGKVCSARVGSLSITTRYGAGTLDDVQAEILDARGEYPAVEPADPETLSPQEIAQMLWQTQTLRLVGDLVEVGDCEGALWARDAALPAPMLLRTSGAPTTPAAQLLERFAGSDRLAALERDYREWRTTSEEAGDWDPSWEQVVAANPARVRSWIDAEHRPRVLELTFGNDWASCGSGYDASVATMHELVEGEPTLTEMRTGPVAIMDVDLDGNLEYLYANGDLWGEGAQLVSVTERLQVSIRIEQDFYCPC